MEKLALFSHIKASFLDSLGREFERDFSWERIKGVDNRKDKLLIITPFLDRHNDYIEIVVTELKDGRLELSDGGQTYADLFISGIETATIEKHKDRINEICNGFGVTNGEELTVFCVFDNIGEKLFGLLQVCQIIDSMRYWIGGK